MKRIVMLATLLAFVLGMAATASASDLVTSGGWKIAATWMNNYDFIDDDTNEQGGSENDFAIDQRLRAAFTWVANENLQGVLQLEIGSSTWGLANDGADLGADDLVVEVKHSYISFVWPNTEVSITAGVMPIALPGGPGGNPIFDADVAGAVISAPLLDNVSILAGYTRLVSELASVDNRDENTATDNNLDALFLAVPMSFMDDGINLTPYAAFVYSGSDFLRDYDDDGDTQWDDEGLVGLLTQNMTVGDTDATGVNISYYGLVFDISLLDPFNISGAYHYGTMHGPWADTDRSGWLGEIQLTYTGFDFVTPALYFAYSSGEDGNSTGGDDTYSKGDGASERLPVVAESYGVGSFWFGNDWMDDDIIGAGDEQFGFWTVGLFLTDISFVEGLTHEINILYVEGTNDETTGSRYRSDNDADFDYGQYLTEKDSLWEFDLNTKYQIYDELSAVVRLGYINMDYDEDVWNEIRDAANADNGGDKDAAKLLIGLEYKF